jgi:Zn-finger in ubiquitin-hydrolases and other protein
VTHAAPCAHFAQASDITPSGPGCGECLRTGTTWVHLRVCMTCGQVRCCDSSPGRHAMAHFHGTGHPLVQSYEPNESWWWCYVDSLLFQVPDAASYAYR